MGKNPSTPSSGGFDDSFDGTMRGAGESKPGQVANQKSRYDLKSHVQKAMQQFDQGLMQGQMGHQQGGYQPSLLSDAPPIPNFTAPNGSPFQAASNAYLANNRQKFFGIPAGGESKKKVQPGDDEEDDGY